MAYDASPIHFDHPAAAEFTPENPSDEPFMELFGEQYHTNPKYLIDGAAMLMVALWHQARGPAPVLPDGGGGFDQAEIMMASFAAMDWALRNLPADMRR